MELYEKMNSQNTVLLVIDPVNSCAHENCETPEWGIYFSKIRQMLPKLADFIDQWRKKVLSPVVFVKITPWNKENLPLNINKLYLDPRATYYSDDKTGFDEQFHTVKPKPEDVVFTKNTYDAFANGELEKFLKAKGIQYIVVAGIFTDGCVLASIVSGFARGFNFVVLKDLVETTDVEIRQNLQKLLLDYTFPVLYGKTLSSDEFLSGWQYF